MIDENVKKIQIVIIAAIAVAINVVGGKVAEGVPMLFLDTIGTIFIAAAFGMRYGILTAVITHIVLAALGGGTIALAFLPVSLVIAIIVALMARGGFSYKKALLTGILLGLIATFVGATIKIALFGGLTGGGTDVIVIGLKGVGLSNNLAVYIGATIVNMLDKIISCLLVAVLIKALSKNEKFKALMYY